MYVWEQAKDEVRQHWFIDSYIAAYIQVQYRVIGVHPTGLTGARGCRQVSTGLPPSSGRGAGPRRGRRRAAEGVEPGRPNRPRREGAESSSAGSSLGRLVLELCPAYTPGTSQTSLVYSSNPVLHLFISCYVTVNKPVLSYLLLCLLPQEKLIWDNC